MAISVRNANVSEFNKQKPQIGMHLCRVKDIRQKKGHKGEGLWVDFVVESGASPKGFEFSHGIYPGNARASGQMTVDMARAKEEGKIITVVAAILGYQGGDVFRVTQEVFDNACKRPVSPHAGRYVYVSVKPHKNMKGEDTCFYEFSPLPAEEQAIFPLAEPTQTAPAAAAPPPPPGAAAPAPAPAFPPPGWAPHTDPAYAAAGWYYCGQLVKHRSELGG